MKKTISSYIPVSVEVTFDYDPYSAEPVTNIKLDSLTGWELSKEVERAFGYASSNAMTWCSLHALDGGWKRPWTEGGQEDPPPSVCELFNAASYDDLSEAESKK